MQASASRPPWLDKNGLQDLFKTKGGDLHIRTVARLQTLMVTDSSSDWVVILLFFMMSCCLFCQVFFVLICFVLFWIDSSAVSMAIQCFCCREIGTKSRDFDVGSRKV